MSNNFIQTYDSVLSVDQCNAIIEWMEEKRNDALWEKNKSRDMKSIVRPTMYESFKEHDQHIVGALRKYYYKYTRYFEDVSYNDHHLEQWWKLQKSEPGAGFTSWHYEHGPQAYAKGRYLVWMIYLNETQGGATEFKYQNRSIWPKPGRLVIWPASWTHTHRQRDNLQSVKYIATGWWRYE